MRIRWTMPAASDLEHIHSYLTRHRPALARSTIRELCDAIASLKQNPYRGRPGREPETRELVFTRMPYVAVYRISTDAIEVLHIFHAAQQRS